MTGLGAYTPAFPDQNNATMSYQGNGLGTFFELLPLSRRGVFVRVSYDRFGFERIASSYSDFPTNELVRHESRAEVAYIRPGRFTWGVRTAASYIFDRAYNAFKMLYKIHQVEAYFVVRAKNNLQYKLARWKRRLPENVLSDSTICLTGVYSKQHYPKPLRLIRYWDEQQQREFTFLTNATHISALQVAGLDKNRWQVELFFKWLMQHLKIKKFWGTTENAVRIQLYTAICTYCLVDIVQHDMQLDRSTYEVLQILSISLTDKTNLRELFDKTKFQYDKERTAANEQYLVNF
jgi:hypothetical protein